MAEKIIDQGAFNEAQDIVRNPNNFRYKFYHQNDRATVDHVSSLFRRADPSEGDLSDSTPAQLRTPPDSKKADGNPQAGSDPADDERAAAEAALIAHWGGEAQAKVQVVSDWARSTIGEAGLEALHQKYPGLMNDAGVIKALHAALSR